MTILLSTTSQELISKLSKIDKNFPQPFQQRTEIDRASLLKWLEQSHSVTGNDEGFFLIASLQASLLKDLKDSLNKSLTKKDDSKKNTTLSKAKLALLALAGTIYFGCEGFDGVTAIMGMFSFVPTLAFFIAGTLFSILSIIVFYSFDLVEISKNLGVKSTDAPKLLDVLLDEFKQIKLIRAHLSKSTPKTLQELEQDLEIAKMLLKRHEDLNEARSQLKSALENPYLKAGKMITAGIAGIIFFSGGFFAGQAVALTIASAFVPVVAATAWPIIAVGVLVGLAAFSIYWFVERPGIENLIRRWKGLDKEKMDQLCKSKVVDRETEKLQNLIQGIEERIELKRVNTTAQSQVQTLVEEVSRLKQQLAQKTTQTMQSHVDKAGNDELIFDKQGMSAHELKPIKEGQASPHAQYSLFKFKDMKPATLITPEKIQAHKTF
ncbi:hypothetical protein [Legionella longbeachae]|uniref:Coiled-coil protein n=1 Tax=Legionella longbeachae serogroup 1 (strain NSW150) TaxID=661367 RepID=D3HPE8_LEGLN|nr:hypothetical protein [Legionella longbeachae]VEE01288.1 coiled-coil protein [Legionella oakridgensis]HBD7398276.1 hypothetical protein [Legionella pneumophila]ARB92347.1 hypothetical protein A6J40_09245 [Legionella longbeachae]ARM34472.1 inorganic phosphate transporter [Legionella longbeachae]EEZ96236.1 conserved hypothetical protein [Legionella longbeachae D-4968]